MTILSQTLLALVSRHLMSFALFTARHNFSVLVKQFYLTSSNNI